MPCNTPMFTTLATLRMLSKNWPKLNITRAIILQEPLPAPEALKVEYAAYLNGLAEAAGEFAALPWMPYGKVMYPG